MIVRSRESLQDDHGRATCGAMPKRVLVGSGSCFCKGSAGKQGEELTTKGDSRSAEAIGEKSEVANAHERLGQHMQEETAQELASPELHLAQLATVGIILPAEGDKLSVECNQAMIGNGHAVGVAAQIST